MENGDHVICSYELVIYVGDNLTDVEIAAENENLKNYLFFRRSYDNRYKNLKNY